MQTMNQQVAASARDDVYKAFSRKPTWEEFKAASKESRVRVNKTVAAQAIHLKGMPTAYMLIYGIITLWVGFLVLPATLAAYFFIDLSAWWILEAAGLGWFLVKVSRKLTARG